MAEEQEQNQGVNLTYLMITEEQINTAVQSGIYDAVFKKFSFEMNGEKEDAFSIDIATLILAYNNAIGELSQKNTMLYEMLNNLNQRVANAAQLIEVLQKQIAELLVQRSIIH